jgi:hypothetical protein
MNVIFGLLPINLICCGAGDPGSIPGGGKLNAYPLPGGQLTSTHYSQYMPVLRIRDPVPFRPLDPGSGIGFFRTRISDPGSQPHIFENLLTILVKKFYNSLKIGPNFFLQQFKTEIFCNFEKFVDT